MSKHLEGEVKKDNDVRAPLLLVPGDAVRLGASLRRDAAFLSSQRVMDYSLLVGVSKQTFEIDLPIRQATSCNL